MIKNKQIINVYYFEEKIDYGKIRLALAILEKENTAL